MWSLFDSFLTFLQVKAANSMWLHVCAEERVERQGPWTSSLMCSIKSSPNSDQAQRSFLVHCPVLQQCLAVLILSVDCALCNFMRYHWTKAALMLQAYCRDRFNLLVENLPVALCMVHYMCIEADCSHWLSVSQVEQGISLTDAILGPYSPLPRTVVPAVALPIPSLLHVQEGWKEWYAQNHPVP